MLKNNASSRILAILFTLFSTTYSLSVDTKILWNNHEQLLQTMADFDRDDVEFRKKLNEALKAILPEIGEYLSYEELIAVFFQRKLDKYRDENLKIDFDEEKKNLKGILEKIMDDQTLTTLDDLKKKLQEILNNYFSQKLELLRKYFIAGILNVQSISHDIQNFFDTAKSRLKAITFVDMQTTNAVQKGIIPNETTYKQFLISGSDKIAYEFQLKLSFIASNLQQLGTIINDPVYYMINSIKKMINEFEAKMDSILSVDKTKIFEKRKVVTNDQFKAFNKDTGAGQSDSQGALVESGKEFKRINKELSILLENSESEKNGEEHLKFAKELIEEFNIYEKDYLEEMNGQSGTMTDQRQMVNYQIRMIQAVETIRQFFFNLVQSILVSRQKKNPKDSFKVGLNYLSDRLKIEAPSLESFKDCFNNDFVKNVKIDSTNSESGITNQYQPTVFKILRDDVLFVVFAKLQIKQSEAELIKEFKLYTGLYNNEYRNLERAMRYLLTTSPFDFSKHVEIAKLVFVNLINMLSSQTVLADLGREEIYKAFEDYLAVNFVFDKEENRPLKLLIRVINYSLSEQNISLNKKSIEKEEIENLLAISSKPALKAIFVSTFNDLKSAGILTTDKSNALEAIGEILQTSGAVKSNRVVL